MKTDKKGIKPTILPPEEKFPPQIDARVAHAQDGKGVSTKIRKARMIAALEKALGIVTVACKTVGLERKTHYRWLDKDPKYAAACAEIDEVAIDFVESKMHQRIGQGDSYLIGLYMKTKGRRRDYIERSELVGRDGSPLVPEKRQVMIINGKEIEF